MTAPASPMRCRPTFHSNPAPVFPADIPARAGATLVTIPHTGPSSPPDFPGLAESFPIDFPAPSACRPRHLDFPWSSPLFPHLVDFPNLVVSLADPHDLAALIITPPFDSAMPTRVPPSPVTSHHRPLRPYRRSSPSRVDPYRHPVPCPAHPAPIDFPSRHLPARSGPTSHPLPRHVIPVD